MLTKNLMIVTLIVLSIFLGRSQSDDLLSPPLTAESSETSVDSDDKNSNERKSAKGLEENEEESGRKGSDEKEPENIDQFSKFISEGLNFPASAIKIIKAPADLSKDKDSKKVSETITMLLENQEKWIQKIESELDDLNKQEESNLEEPPRERTPDEIEGE